MKKLFPLLALALVACQSVSEVIPTGQNTYMVGANSQGGFTSDAEVAALGIKRANEFCANQGKSMEMISTSSSGTQGWTPQNSQTLFRCVSK
jgi:hypothetical protein